MDLGVMVDVEEGQDVTEIDHMWNDGQWTTIKFWTMWDHVGDDPAPPFQGEYVDLVQSYKYLGVHLDNKLDWSEDTGAIYKKGQSRLYFLRRLRSFDVRGPMLNAFHQSVVASALFFAAVCWGSSIKAADTNRLDKLLRRAASVLGTSLEPVSAVAERRMLSKLLTIMDNASHPLYDTLARQKSVQQQAHSALVHHRAAQESGQTVCSGGPNQPCYKIAYFRDVSSRVAFREAHQACEMEGGSLLSIESPAEQRDIENLLQELRSGAVGGSGGGGIADGDFWIGLTRVDGGDQNHVEPSNTLTSCPQLYHWTDGSPASFRNWYFDEPSCGGEACVVMYHQPTALPGLGGAYLYQWNDDRCNMKHNFICKYQPESHVVKEQGNRRGGRGTGMLLVYVIIPTIPLLLLILVASGTCCFQMLSRSKPRTKTTVNQSNLWISKTPKADSMEV
ncbi:chondrolectin [Diretmus argenteus]